MTRYGIVRLIENEADLAVCGEAPDAPAALAAVKARKPELVLTDLTMPGREGLELIKDMRAQHPEVPALVMSMHEEEIYAERALRAGARGYVMKDAGAEQLLKAIRQVLSGRIYLSDSMSDRAAESLSGRCHRAGESTLVALTDREFEVFCLLGKGLSTRQIAQQLHLSQKTVEPTACTCGRNSISQQGPPCSNMRCAGPQRSREADERGTAPEPLLSQAPTDRRAPIAPPPAGRENVSGQRSDESLSGECPDTRGRRAEVE